MGEDCKGDASLAAAESRLAVAAEGLDGQPHGATVAAIVPVAAIVRTAARVGGGTTPALFYDVAAGVVGRVIRRSLVLFAENVVKKQSSMPVRAHDEQGSEEDANVGHRACLLSHEYVADAQALAADTAKHRSSSHDTSVDVSSTSFFQAVSYPLTPRRLIALKDRNELASNASDAKQHVPSALHWSSSNELALDALDAQASDGT